MRDRVFLDTNIILYAYSTEQDKNKIVYNILDTFNDIYISKQVINETINILIKKFNLQIEDVENSIKELDREFEILDFDLQTQLKALDLKRRYNFQYYDSLIVATALENYCDILYSEDMQNGLVVDGRLKIINPFK